MSENLPAKLNSMLAVNFDEMRIFYRRLDAAWKSIYKLEIPISWVDGSCMRDTEWDGIKSSITDHNLRVIFTVDVYTLSPSLPIHSNSAWTRIWMCNFCKTFRPILGLFSNVTQSHSWLQAFAFLVLIVCQNCRAGPLAVIRMESPSLKLHLINQK